MRKHNFKFKSAFAILTAVIIAILSIFILSQYWSYKTSEEEYQTIKQRSDRRINDFLDLVLKERCKDVQADTKLKAENFAKELSSTYSNSETFKYDVDSVDRYTDLDVLLNKHFSGQYFEGSSRYNNHILVSVNEQIIYERSGIYPFEEGQQRTFDDILEYSNNKELTSLAIDNIMNYNLEKRNYIFWETTPNSNPDHIKISDMTTQSLIDIYTKEKLAGFKTLDLLVTVYITDDGDIFGTKDINKLGYKQDNYKIAVIQRINMYDLLLDYQHYLDRYVGDLDVLTNYFAANEQNIFMMCIISLIALILVICLYANFQNKWVQSNDENIE